MTDKTEDSNSIQIPRERLQKRIAKSGYCSRRHAEQLIVEGRVKVNGSLITTLGTQVSEEDTVSVDGKTISAARKVYLVMNKPKGYITTLSDPFNRLNVSSLLPDLGMQLKPVGRLDKDTEGLIIFTNDGNLINKLLHPKHHIEKEYVAQLKGCIHSKAIKKLESGILLDGVKTKPANVKVIHVDEQNEKSTIHLTISEGRKHQVKKMCLYTGFPVKKLKRIRMGPIELDKLKVGTCRMLTKPECDMLIQLLER